MAKGDQKIPLELKQRARAEMYSAIERVWKLAPERMRQVRVQVTFTDGETIGQKRQTAQPGACSNCGSKKQEFQAIGCGKPGCPMARSA